MAGNAGADPAEDIAAKQTQAETVRNEINSLNIEMEINIESYNAASVELEGILGRIAENEATLQETQSNLQISQERLEKRIVSLYRNGSTDMIDVLMETSDINEFMTRFDLLTKVGEQDRDDLEQIKQFKIQVEEAKLQLAEDQAAQSTLVDELASKKDQIEAGIAEKQQMAAGLEGEIAALEAEQQARDLAAAQAQIAAASSGSSDSGGYDDSGYTPPPPYSGGGDIVSIAYYYIGVPYVWGGTSPSGFDCSGLTQYVYAQAGISIPRVASAQQSAGSPVSMGDLQPGDLVFFGYPAYHVGIYIGGGSMIHAPYPGASVTTAPLMGDFSGGARY